MSEENAAPTNEEVGAPNTEVKSYSEADVRAMLEKETAGLKSKVDELLGEKKSASQKAREAEERVERERLERAKQEKDFESLFKSSEEKRSEIENKYKELNTSIRNEKRNTEAYKLANELATGPNAELLSEFVARRLDVGEDGKLVVMDANGNPTVSTLADLKKEFVSSGKYDALLSGTGATGGGATNSRSGGASISGKKLSEMTRSEKIEYFKQKREG